MKRALALLFLSLAVLGLAACASSHPRVVRGAPPRPSAAEIRKLAHLALRVARRAGDAHPTDALVVRTTRRIAEAVDAGSGVGYDSTPAYFLVVRGQFKDCGVPQPPPGGACPTGTVMTLTVDPRTNTSTDFGIESRMPDVNKIGTSEPLPLTNTPVARASASAPVRADTTGLQLTAAPAGYQPALSEHEVIDRFRRAHFRESYAPGSPAAHLWTVNGAYPAWVLEFRHHGETTVAVYDLRGRRWTMSFRYEGGSPPCRNGVCGFPLNQGGLDMAAGYAERFAGAAQVFTSDRVDAVSDRVVLHLVHAPRSVIAALNAAHPGTYVIHNDGLRTLGAVMAVQRALDFTTLWAKGVAIVAAWPSDKGRLIVGVMKDIPTAQAYFDATYGRGFVHVVHADPIEPTQGATGPVLLH